LKSNIPLIVVLTTILFITGCTPSDSVETKKEKEFTIVDENELKIDDSEEEFSYLTDFSEEELKSYKRFIMEYDTNYLKEFSPEKIMLLYIHSAVIDDLEAIYSLAYIEEGLPNFDTFKKQYYQNLKNSNLEMSLDFRYYDTIQIKQEDGNGLLVEITVIFGKFTASTFVELKKENDIWKIVLPDLSSM